jgi:2-iminobutanoate/2-iminopropanoate deaminase
MEKTILQADRVYKPMGDYSQGIKIKGGSLVFINGKVALDQRGNLVGQGDIRAQSKQAFQNVKEMLESAGATFRDVVRLGIFLTNIDDFPAVSEVRKEYITEPFPTTMVVSVNRLLDKEWLIAVEAIAVVE